MKKFVVLLVVVAMTCVSAMAFAAEVTVGGSVEVRSRNFSNLDFNDDATDKASTSQKDTQTRMKIDVNAKAGDVKGKLSLWNDFETWADNNITSPSNGTVTTFETQPGSTVISGPSNTGSERNTIGFREAWLSFDLPGIPVNVTAGHQLLTIGNGWFFRSMHFGSDAWVVSNHSGPNTLALVNVKFAEANVANSDDVDAYSIIDVFKLSDTMSVGADLTLVNNRSNKAVDKDNLMNLGVNFNGKVGPVGLKAEVDYQMGEQSSTSDYAGYQAVVQGNVALDPVTVNFTVAMGSGDDGTSADVDTFVNALDVDPHYTFLWEYKVGHPGVLDLNDQPNAKNFGFANTTAIGAGATFAVAPSLTIGADLWWLQSTEDIPVKVGTGTTTDLGTEVDVKVNWKIADNLTWNWVLGYLMAGDGLGEDDAMGAQGVLAFKF